MDLFKVIHKAYLILTIWVGEAYSILRFVSAEGLNLVGAARSPNGIVDFFSCLVERKSLHLEKLIQNFFNNECLDRVRLSKIELELVVDLELVVFKV